MAGNHAAEGHDPQEVNTARGSASDDRVTSLKWAPALLACACQPLVFPRTAEIAKPKGASLQADVQVALIEPQSAVQLDGTHLRSTVSFIPDVGLDVHLGLGQCELGLVGVDLGGMLELRCMAVRQAAGAPFSLAFSGAAGATASAGIGFAPSARVGVDMSRRVGVLEPLLDVYLSTERQAHYIQTGVVNDPVVAPAGIIVGQQELRLSVPVGVAIIVPERQPWALGLPLRSVIIGLEPWFVLAKSSHTEIDPTVQSYTTSGWGLSFTVGLAFR